MIGTMWGGAIVFGGGLPLYDERGSIGGFGVSGDTSCADYDVAWRGRRALELNHAPNAA
jgi:uncharacterized protein GlcG (DUF336 family)